jgi:CheY-like chemotaxis protein
MILKKVLVIDDDDLSIFLIGMTLEDIAFIESHESVNSGWEALHYLNEKDTTPDLILVDLNMPEMDGYEFIQRFEKDYWQDTPSTQVIVVTSSQRESDKNKSLSFKSVVGFIQKPISEEKIKGVLGL